MLSKTCAALTCALMLFATACGSDSSVSGSETGATIKHKFGTTKVPKDPKKIVTLGYNDHEFLLAMGVEPIAIRDWVGVGPITKVPWAKDEIDAMKKQPKVIPRTDLKPEQVLAMKPDLIIGVFGGMTKREYDALTRSGIPVVAPPKQYVDFGVPWQEQALITGKAVGKEKEAQKLVADLEGRFDKAREAHPEFEGKSGIVPYAFPGEYGAYASEDLRTRFISELGFKPPKEIDKLAGKEFYVEFSKEQFRLMDQDMVLMYGGPRAKRKEIQGDKLYSRLNAVKEGRVVYMDNEDDTLGAVGLSSPLSLPYALDQTVPRMAAAVDGDPKTKVKEVQ